MDLIIEKIGLEDHTLKNSKVLGPFTPEELHGLRGEGSTPDKIQRFWGAVIDIVDIDC